MKYYLFILFLSITALNAQPAVEKVSVQLQWADQFQFAGYYIAKEKGYYRDAGLDVTIQKFDSKKLAVDEVMAGHSTYGIGRSSLLVDRMKGRNVVALAAIFQSSPFILLSQKSADIKTPRDLVGKRIMMTQDFQDTISVRAMLNSQGLSVDELKTIEHSYNPMDISNGKTDVMACYISNEPYILKEKGVETNAISPEAYGFDFYSDILFTSDLEVRNHPKRVRAFVDATLKGWEYAFSHIPETAQLIRTHYNGQNKSLESLVYEGEVLKSLAYRGDQPLGAITVDKFRRISDIYRVMGIHQDEKRLDGFIYDDTGKQSVALSVDEHSFLHTNIIRYTSIEQWPPFTFYPEHNSQELQGIGVDFWKLIVERTGMKSSFTPSLTWGGILESMKTKIVDVALGTSISKEKERYALFSKPYATFANVIVTGKAIDFLPGLNALGGKRVAIAEGNNVAESIALKYPDITIIGVEDTREALNALSSGRVDAVIDILPSVAYLINEDHHVDLKISGTTEFNFDLRMMIRNDYPELKSIIDKAIDSISIVDRQKIMNQYIAITYEDRVDYSWVYGIALAALFIISIFIYRQFEMGKYNKRLLKMATTDPLTGLTNRIRLDEKLLECYHFYERTGRIFSVIMIDLDYFKRVNDTYGHLVGDKTLVIFAKLLSDNIRNVDIVGRWGGEEFMIICPDTTLTGGEQLAEKIKSVIEMYDFPHIHTLTCSFGISESREGDRIENIVGRADSALYQAKAEGRNRICIS
ncbi:MAG: ABC transporter substrate-binding protein [Sulfuricurvum sp.]|uniref:transporter substrate-binding domain-containing diguanylate cyclase n=1 Tax=Sulfuricurvum sp. TaxID=2025608 RepID=UPI0025CE75CB|nr:ABC transporter substrate-binding protein [Sulfuricurvum sp.]MBV5321681.1 ABC transporter substrate-binding protein [Sulfuricurvum sp.]